MASSLNFLLQSPKQNMFECNLYNPDNIFKKFKVLEFPISFVGLSSTQELDVEENLETSAYLKTMFDGIVMKFEEAWKISASHRAFRITRVNNHRIKITFKPMNESISRAKMQKKQIDNRFVFDLRLFKISGTLCCNNESHAEIGRFYISAQYENCNITHSPKKVNFGEVLLLDKSTRYVRIRNESQLLSAKMAYVKISGFEVYPKQFTIFPNCSKRVLITATPTGLKVNSTIVFEIRNPNDDFNSDPTKKINENFISYVITADINVILKPNRKEVVVESLHHLFEQSPYYTYMDEELAVHKKRNVIALKKLHYSKCPHVKQPIVEKYISEREKCYFDSSSRMLQLKDYKQKVNFCTKLREYVSIYDLFEVLIIPFSLEFGRIGLNTFGEKDIIVKNSTKYFVTVRLMKDDCVTYTHEKLSCIKIKLKPYSQISVTVTCLGLGEGIYTGLFEYLIDEKFHRKHPYNLSVGNPTLMIDEKDLKFGMVTNECFVSSVSVRIQNYFNVPIEYEWNEINPDVPFVIIPNSGSVPLHSTRICDITYVCKLTKSKSHEVELISKGLKPKIIPIELNVLTRKLAMKFLQPSVIFKDMALNLEVVEKVKFENSSREFALFYVVEPVIPGIRIEPMSGTIRPKMILTFEIIAKMTCLMEFAFELTMKINNKEILLLPISGNVVEPKVTIRPKNIYMSRIPCSMITFVPITFQNLSSLRATVEVLDTGDENIFNLYVAQGYEKQRVFNFNIDAGQTKIVFIKVFDTFRREYDMYMPFKINGLLGPPNQDKRSTEIQYYIGQHAQHFENHPKIKVKSINKDISYCRITGVFTLPWIEFSNDKFEIDYNANSDNKMTFTMTNISKYYFHVTILISQLSPNFSLEVHTEETESIVNETNLKFELYQKQTATFYLKFHPKGHGRFVAVAVLFLDKYLTLPYSNMTFIGRRQSPCMIPSTHRIIFPPSRTGTVLCHDMTVRMEAESALEDFAYSSKEEQNLSVEFVDIEITEENEKMHTTVLIKLSICCETPYTRNITLTFTHICGSGCDIQVHFCYTRCPLMLHTEFLVTPVNNPYPYFPLNTQEELYEYMESCSSFLEKWMFQQGYRRDLFPVIPDTFLAISSSIMSQIGTKTKGISVSYLNFIRRIAGPLMKYVRKVTVQDVDESFKPIKEIYDTYQEIINLLRSRGANLWVLQAKFLLSYDQFVIYFENVTPKCNADIILVQELLADVNLFNRLNKQSWIDFILQSYKVFVMDSCFFDCVCVGSQSRDIIKIIVEWYNEHIALQHSRLRGRDKPVKVVTNITTDLSDGIALISTIINYCPFLEEHFSLFCELDENNKENSVINNACLIIEAMNHLRLYFPLNCTELLHPNFLQMLFLSIHLYVTLPLFKPKDVIDFKPPLLRSSMRQLAISPTTQETLLFNYFILNNNKNSFSVEKAPAVENGKKMYINVKYTANFVEEDTALLLAHGYNKTRIFDTYIIFELLGRTGALNPVKKCKVTGPLYRPIRVDVLLSSPFIESGVFEVYLTDTEPTIPVEFKKAPEHGFFVRRLNLIEKEIFLNGIPKESGEDKKEHKMYLQLICLNNRVGNSWIWFKSDVGQFFIKVVTHTRDLPLDTLQVKVESWPMDPCSCEEACDCYRTTVLMIPHRNELMLKSLRFALLENASQIMIRIFDELIESTTGRIILAMLLAEFGTNISDVQHILKTDINYRISSRYLLPRMDHVTLALHSSSILPLPVTIPLNDKSYKYSITFTSECLMDIRTYKILFIESNNENELQQANSTKGKSGTSCASNVTSSA